MLPRVIQWLLALSGGLSFIAVLAREGYVFVSVFVQTVIVNFESFTEPLIAFVAIVLRYVGIQTINDEPLMRLALFAIAPSAYWAAGTARRLISKDNDFDGIPYSFSDLFFGPLLSVIFIVAILLAFFQSIGMGDVLVGDLLDRGDVVEAIMGCLAIVVGFGLFVSVFIFIRRRSLAKQYGWEAVRAYNIRGENAPIVTFSISVILFLAMSALTATGSAV